jgi:hypothetical protein
MQKYSTSFFTWWLGLTVIYLVLFSVGPDRLAAAVGLFVPFGFLNAVLGSVALTAGNFWVLVPLVALIALFFYSQTITRRLGITSTWAKISYNLAVLLVLTLITDLAIYGTWMSWGLLLGQPFSFGA